MNFDIIQQFCKLSAAFAPSGCEDGVIKCIDNMIEQFVPDSDKWERKTDAMNNLFYHKKGNGKKILLAAHMDSIGFMITHIDDSGFARFAPVGGIMREDLIDIQVRFENGTKGVISFEEKTPLDKQDMSNLFIDIGASDRKQAEKYIKIGDMAVYNSDIFTQGNIICGPYLDNRIGCLTLVDAMSKLENTEKDITVAFTSQEEVGLRGAAAAAFSVQPEIAIAVDVTDTGDMPERKYPMAVKMGAGPAVKVMDRSVICDADIRDDLYAAADALNIPVQKEIMQFGGTDTGAIQRSRGGVKAGAVSIPTRYIHSPSEMAALSDILQSSQLIAYAVDKVL